MHQIISRIAARRRLFLISLLALLAVAWWLWPSQTVTFRQEDIHIQSRGWLLPFAVEIAETPQQHRRGLMYRKTLDENAGMLFLSPEERDMPMWMKNTPLSLDMLFLDNRGVIVYIAHNTQPHSEDRISAGRKVRGVLEIAGGAAERHNIMPGDRVLHPTFSGLRNRP